MALLDTLIGRGEAPPSEEIDAPGGGKPDTTPKRGPGRPKGSVNKTTVASVTRRVKDQIAAIVAAGNMVLVRLAPEDTLSDDEMTLLTDALVAEATASVRIQTWLTKTSGVSAHFLLFTAVITIIYPRLVRRKLAPRIPGVFGEPELPPMNPDMVDPTDWFARAEPARYG